MKATKGEKTFYTINYIMLALFGLSCLLPLLNIIAVSLSSSDAIMSGTVSIFPREFSMDSYKLLFEGTNVMGAFKNSIVITVVGVILNMVFTILAAYPLSRKYFYGRKFFTMAMVFTMLFGAGMIPSYMLVKFLRLTNTYWAIWIPGLVSTYNMLVMKSFFEGIPEELIEAARIDGCSEVRLLVSIILPLSKAVLATLTLFYGVGNWNNFMGVLIYINETSKYNLSVFVQQMIQSQSLLQQVASENIEDISQITPEGIKSAGIMVMVVPLMIVYPFLQKYFVKGVMLGSVKG
jgi:putative aldouronate transport system permease protein